jgi:tetratricopeptide (TPR) repeat protein
MSQPPENRPTYPPYRPPSGVSPHEPKPLPPSPFVGGPPEPEKPPRRPRWGLRLLLLLLIVLPIGSCAALFVPQEVAGWYLTAALENREAGKNEEAYKNLGDAMRWLPDNPALLLQRGAWLLEDGETDSALADANRAADLSGDNYWVLSVRAQIFQKLGRHEEAIEDWKTIDRLSQAQGQPDRATALNGLAYARAVGKIDLKKGFENVDEALDLYPDNAAIRDTRGYLLHLTDKNEAALVDLDFAVKGMDEQLILQGQMPARRRRMVASDVNLEGLNSPEHGAAVVRYHRALVLQALGREKEADEDLQKVRELIGREPDEKLF